MWRVIGKGLYGTVHHLCADDSDNSCIVVKGITKDCHHTAREYRFQKAIYVAFQELRRSQIESRLLRNVQRYIRISKPLFLCGSPLYLDEQRFECGFGMTRLHGVALRTLDCVVTPDFVPSTVQAHLAFNTHEYGLKGADITKKVSESNMVRGYYMSTADDCLSRMFPSDITIDDLKNIMRFVLLYIVYSCDLYPKDVEFSVGYDPTVHEYVINVLDFGMVTNKGDNILDELLQGLSEEPYVSFVNTSADRNNTVDIISLCEEITGKRHPHRFSKIPDVSSMSIKTLRHELDQKKIPYGDVIEKSELVRRLLQYYS